jgi:dienelactone hydrolase
MNETVTYEVAGQTFPGTLAAPDNRNERHEVRRAGVLVFHGGGGPTAHERERIDKLAALGYVALAPDLFGEVFADRARGVAVIGELIAEPAILRARTQAALDVLANRSDVDRERIAAIGHCFGGLAALELARSGANVRAVVSFHGRLTSMAPAKRGDIQAHVLACTGADDPFCPRDQRAVFEEEMSGAAVDWQHHIYAGAMHGFSVPGLDPGKQPGCAYHELADRRSWAAMLGLFAEVLR